METGWEGQDGASTTFALTPDPAHVAASKDALFFVKTTSPSPITVMDTVYRLGVERAEASPPRFELRPDRILRYGNQTVFVE